MPEVTDRPLVIGEDHGFGENIVAWFHSGEECESATALRPADDRLRTGCSLVICTYQRAQSLNRFLDSLQSVEQVPDQLIIVDASPTDETERVIRSRPSQERLAKCLIYVRVSGPLKGLTRQRNFGVSLVNTDLVAFFDDDIVLMPGCIEEMVKTLRDRGDEVAGVGASLLYPGSEPRTLRALWRLRLLLRMVSSLRPGSYQRSGMSLPWVFLPPTAAVVEGDWLSGAANMWHTRIVREVGFCEAFGGYAMGEDLDFSLRAGQRGKIVLAGAAQVRHFHEASGRPNHSMIGYMAVYNAYQIHRRGLRNRTWRDVVWFAYSWTLDTLFLTHRLLLPRRWGSTLQQMGGRIKAARDLMMGQ